MRSMLRWWLGIRSPSAEAAQAGRSLADAWVEGWRRGEERRKAGLPPEPLSPEAIAWAEGVVRRSFPSFYDDEDEDEETRP